MDTTIPVVEPAIDAMLGEKTRRITLCHVLSLQTTNEVQWELCSDRFRHGLQGHDVPWCSTMTTPGSDPLSLFWTLCTSWWVQSLLLFLDRACWTKNDTAIRIPQHLHNIEEPMSTVRGDGSLFCECRDSRLGLRCAGVARPAEFGFDGSPGAPKELR